MESKKVNHPPHYWIASNIGRDILYTLGFSDWMFEIECIDAIELLNLDFHRGNAVKYLYRCGEKGDPVTDLQKAAWYLNRYLWMYDENPIFSIQWFLSRKYRKFLPQVREALRLTKNKISEIKDKDGQIL